MKRLFTCFGCLAVLVAPAAAQNVTFDFESNVVDDGFFAPLVQTVGDLQLRFDFGQMLNRDDANMVNNTFVFNQTNSPIGSPLNISITVNDVADEFTFLPFRLISIDTANTPGLQLNRMRGINNLVDEFSVDIANTAGGGDLFETQSTDGNGTPLGDFVIGNLVFNYENGVDGEFQFPAIDNIVISTDLDPMGTPGDADGDGDVDGGDFLTYQRDDSSQIPTWQSNYPLPAAASFAAVPEPTTLASCLIMLAAGGLVRAGR